MKKLLSLLLLCATLTASAQSRYETAMQSRVAAFDTTRNPAGLLELANAFERIGEAEKTQWLPYYYASLSLVTSGMMAMNPQGGAPEGTDALADRAEALLLKAESMQANNSDIYLVRKMIATLRMMVDPMSRYMQYGQQSQQALEKAKALDPTNPRVYLLEGQDKYYTPEQFGGSKAEARKLFEEAERRYAAYKPASSLHPQWGRGTLRYFTALVQ